MAAPDKSERAGFPARASDEQIRRVCRMEHLLELVQRGEDTPQHTVQEALAILSAYCAGPQWREDFETDEAGLFPKTLRRGVLAEDTLYDLLTL